MCDIRLFKSAFMDYQAAVALYRKPFPDEMFFNITAYHLQQCIEKTIKGALECVGVTVPNTHRIPKLLHMVAHNGANLVVTEWLDDHAEMLSDWEAQTRYNMDFIVEKRKLDRAVLETETFLKQNGIDEALREELREDKVRIKLISYLPKNQQCCTDFELNCYYLMYEKRLKTDLEIDTEKGGV